MTIKILIADDHEALRKELSNMVAEQPDMEVIGEAGDGISAVKLASALRPDIIIMDISMPMLNGIDATRRILEANPEIKVVAMSFHVEKEMILAMLKAGASGYLLKENAFPEVIHVIHAVLDKEVYCSPNTTTIILNKRTHLLPKKSLYELVDML